jgi:hypothetical protein
MGRYGKRYADEQFRARGEGPRPVRPLERVECDDTKLDLMVMDSETRLPLGRPWLTTMIDFCTKMITGFYLSHVLYSGLEIPNIPGFASSYYGWYNHYIEFLTSRLIREIDCCRFCRKRYALFLDLEAGVFYELLKLCKCFHLLFLSGWRCNLKAGDGRGEIIMPRLKAQPS